MFAFYITYLFPKIVLHDKVSIIMEVGRGIDFIWNNNSKRAFPTC